MPASAEVEEELLRDTARSDRLIAELAGVEHHAVGRARARLEAAGAIQPVPVRTRTTRWPNGPRQLGRAQRAVLDLGPQATTREIMELSGVGRCAAWKARTRPRVLPDQPFAGGLIAQLPDVAAATDAISVIRTEPAPRRRWPASAPKPDRHAPASVSRPEPRMAGTYADPDPDIDACPACTQVWSDGGWQHDPACVLRLAARR